MLGRLGFLHQSLNQRLLLRCGRLLGKFSMSSLLLRGLRCFLRSRELVLLYFGCLIMVAPRLTSSIAYSTWKSRPSGEKTVIARSYAPGAANTDIMLTSLYLFAFSQSHIITTLKTFPIKAKATTQRFERFGMNLAVKCMETHTARLLLFFYSPLHKGGLTLCCRNSLLSHDSPPLI